MLFLSLGYFAEAKTLGVAVIGRDGAIHYIVVQILNSIDYNFKIFPRMLNQNRGMIQPWI